MTMYSKVIASVVLAVGLGAVVSASAATETVLYAFKGRSDGEAPLAGLIDVGGTLYGTTWLGGTGNLGIVFSATTAGAETVVYSFKGSSSCDGAYPYAGLTALGSKLYGTTTSGGGNRSCLDGEGTVFWVTAASKEKVVRVFVGGANDGSTPEGGLTNVNGTLYGTTIEGGNASCDNGCGTVFSVTKAGDASNVYFFQGVSSADGSGPAASVLNVDGTLYGTTNRGGDDKCSADYGCGAVFSLTTNGAEQVIHAFTGIQGDGIRPFAGLIKSGGRLYSTTAGGGGGNQGTVFSITPAGAEHTLYSFNGSPGDGAEPETGLIKVGDTFYGTTSGGGSDNDGTVFSVTKKGVETIVHSFQGGSDGAVPEGGLIDVNGTLYGTTQEGGSHGGTCGDIGCGTVFAISP